MATAPQPPEPQPDPTTALKLQAMGGLVSDDLRAATRAGHDAAGRTTTNDVATLAGFLRWATPLRYLGDKYASKGFTRERPGGFEVLRSPDGTFDIAVAPGSYATGTDGSPTTRVERGPLTGQAVNANRDQIRFDSNVIPFGPRERQREKAPQRLTWLLLHCFDVFANELRVELSLPVEFTPKGGTDHESGAVTRFQPRLILPPISLAHNAQIEDDEEDEGDDQIDVPVDRRR
ncbi:MAG: hypothetical protein H0U16_04070 [Actinobacteria bacterium]|nr:hypothetical protein [Actinomycetota bacterium]